jgi:hypothetical protein
VSNRLEKNSELSSSFSLDFGRVSLVVNFSVKILFSFSLAGNGMSTDDAGVKANRREKSYGASSLLCFRVSVKELGLVCIPVI